MAKILLYRLRTVYIEEKVDELNITPGHITQDSSASKFTEQKFWSLTIITGPNVKPSIYSKKTFHINIFIPFHLKQFSYFTGTAKQGEGGKQHKLFHSDFLSLVPE